MTDVKKKTVLVIDDEPDIRIFLKAILEDAGFNVMIANNGKHALERLSECKPDLISLDLVMPKMGGVKLLFYLQKNPEWANIPFIIVTAHAHDELGKRDLMKLKAKKILVDSHSYIEKPIIPSEYIKKVNKILGLETIGDFETENLKAKIKDKLKTMGKNELEETLKSLTEKP